MRRELEVVRIETELLENLAGVAMPEDLISREIAGHIDEMRRRRCVLTSTGNARLGIGDDVVVEVNHLGLHQRRQCENDGRGVASWIGDQAPSGDFRAM